MYFSIFLIYLVVIFSSKIVRFLWHLVVGMFSCHSLPIVDRIFFRCFGKSSFVCIVSPLVDISLISLLSPALPGLFPQVVLFFFLCCLLLFVPAYFSTSLNFFILTGFRSFVICVSSQISHPGFDCFFVLFAGSQFSHKLILLLHRFIHLTWLYYSLECKVVCDLFYSFLS